MKMKIKFFVFVILTTITQQLHAKSPILITKSLTEDELIVKLKWYDGEATKLCKKAGEARWNVQTDTENQENREILNQITLEYAKFKNDFYDNVIKDLNIDDFKDEKVKKQLKILKNRDVSALSPEKLEEYNGVMKEMDKIYQLGSFCPYQKPNCIKEQMMTLDPEMSEVMGKSSNYDELLYVWEGWHNVSGRKIRPYYKQYVSLVNEAAKENGFKDYGELWRSSFDDPNFEGTLERLWKEVEPLYDDLHTYVRYKLLNLYNGHMDRSINMIPAHILGNMWAQSWINLYDKIKPFDNASIVDVTSAMKEQDYTPLKMFEMSDEFYKSLGLPNSEMSYTGKSIIEKPKDRVIVCHASAWDFCNKTDFRIKMCTNINMNDFITIHHEMGHIMYYQMYKDQPLLFRAGATPAFHEAVGDTIALSVNTPRHLEIIGLLKDYADTEADNINTLFRMALERVAFLPFGFLIDKWRWDVFSEEIKEENWNRHWWNLREKYQKVYTAINRTEEDLDPGAKYHVPASSQYISYFQAHILEFQFYKALCIEAGQYDPENSEKNPLHKCDYFKNEKAGKMLENGLKLGSSENWKTALKALSGEDEISSKALLEYFKPLSNFLKEENRKMKTQEMKEILENYNTEFTVGCNKEVKASYATQIDIGNKTLQEEHSIAVLENNDFLMKSFDTHFKDVKIEDYDDEDVKRQLRFLTKISINKLSSEKFIELYQTLGRMQVTYSSATICPYYKQDCDLSNWNETWALDPHLYGVMANSEDYDELLYSWQEWRDKSGRLMKQDYERYVELMNEAAQLAGFSDMGELWRDSFEQEGFAKEMKELWSKLEPLYSELHKYVKRHLTSIYGDRIDKSKDTIPAHILGNMWAQTWSNLYEIIKPFPNASEMDVTGAMLAKNMTVLQLFDTANEFFLGLGLSDNSMSYDVSKGAVIEKLKDKIMTCHASAWDFCDGKDFRIKMCTQVNMGDFITIHHEMGHINYYISYKDQPLTLRGGANPGFHEAVGDTIALSVSTPKHLEKIGLLTNYSNTYEDNINALFLKALDRVAFLPYGLIMDMWRWEVFDGTIEKKDWNKRWWELREEYQKVSAPIARDDEKDFDPGSKYHIPYDSQYISYFIAHILDMQLHKALCIEAGQYDPNEPEKNPLHNCDIDGSKKAGEKLKAGLSLGKQKHWSVALKEMTGESSLKPDALLEYYQPLFDYLKKQNELEEEMEKILETYNEEVKEIANLQVKAEWNVNTYVGNDTLIEILNEQTLAYAKFKVDFYNKHLKDVNVSNYVGYEVRKQIKMLSNLDKSALEADKLTQLNEAMRRMDIAYQTGTVCPYGKKECLEDEKMTLDPEIRDVMANSEDYGELKYVWQGWHDVSGKKMRNDYKTYVNLVNEAAEKNGFDDYGALWRSDYDDSDFRGTLDRLWKQVEPLYNDLHTYVRNKLLKLYEKDMDPENKLIPAHILGNMWAQTWVHLYDRLKPFENASIVDVTTEMKKQNYTAYKMFEMSDDFFMSLGLPTSNMSYNGESIIEKPKDRTIVCHASAEDFLDGVDFRIKMCTSVDIGDFVTIHHEMGHIIYFILYKDQPIIFRTSATPAFHEAVGDTIALSVNTPRHLEKIGLLKDYANTKEDNINTLFRMALERVAFLPFGLLIDTWRWDVFSGDVKEENWNKHWWNLREKYQKIYAPVKRTEEDFDPGAKYHVPASSQYIAYFQAHILEFQFYKALCIEAGQYDPKNPEKNPLHQCDFYESKEVGEMLRNGLKLGVSRPWTEALEALTGEKDIDAGALLEYFRPLHDFLKEENMKEVLNKYNEEVKGIVNKQVEAECNVATNTGNEEMIEILNNQTIEFAKFKVDFYESNIKGVEIEQFEDYGLKKQLKMLSNRDISALEPDKLNELNAALRKMDIAYQTGAICPYEKQNCAAEDEKWTLDPEIRDVMANSEDYEELKYVWKNWHDVSGKKMRQDYKTYVKLVNEAADENGFDDYGALWRSDYDDPDFAQTLERLWMQVEPLYNELHTYVRRKLLKLYEGNMDPNNNKIPAHILGNMWAQTWVDLYDRLKPFENASIVDVTTEMKNQNYTVYKMFEMSDEFYMSLGLPTSNMSYNGKSIIEKPSNRTIVCHASAWDFFDGEDFRIKMCTNIDMGDFIVIHHEMGHIMYFLLYKDQPVIFRTGATPAFHEAVGDTIALSVNTPRHLTKIGLLKDYADSKEDNINTLFRMALERVAFLPFGFLIDKWRWDVFSGDVKEENWNKHWWNLREKYQKIYAPIDRTENDFDPGAKYHVPASSQYIAYFQAHILEFQFYKALCIEAEQYDPKKPEENPLHKCDFFGNSNVGLKLGNGLKLGASRPWKEALEALSGEKDIDASALLDYFRPLHEFLKKENFEADMKLTLDTYDDNVREIANLQVDAEWNVATNTGNEEMIEILNNRTLNYAKFKTEFFENSLSNVSSEQFEKYEIQKQVKMLSNRDTGALKPEKLNTLNQALRNMDIVYQTGTICPYNKQECAENEKWTLDPEMGDRMAESDDYDELLYIWKGWRDISGKKMRNDYKTYVELVNEAARENGFDDYGALWRSDYDDENFRETLERLWAQVEPLYNELHTYVRNKLLKIYDGHMDPENNMIPAHLLGNMWAQKWFNLHDRVKPFENASIVDVTGAMKEQGYTAYKMFEMADDFYMSLGLPTSNMSFTGKSIIEKPTNRTIVCHASAWDFLDGEDFRIKMCTSVGMSDFVTVHHEMGHIMYYQMYKDQPVIFRTGATPAFHEAVGDTIALSVNTPRHLQKIQLLENYADSYEDNINTLFRMALERVAFLPFGLLIDTWRWDVFSGAVKEENWNKHWWNLREKYQKIYAPIERTEEDFDPGAKYHVPASSQYIAYFQAHILEFQFYKALCIEAGQYDPNNPEKNPLHKCDFYKNKKAGEMLRNGLKLGVSRPWQEALSAISGVSEIDGSALLEYFEPLYEFLKEANKPLKPEEPKNSIAGVVIGSVVGCIAVIAIAAIGFTMWQKKKKGTQVINSQVTTSSVNLSNDNDV